ncbi:hypothetical protein ACOJVP_07120 [Mycobacterium sp. THU-M116]
MNRAASDNPLGLGLVIVGAVAIAISTFLPLVEPIVTFSRVADNTLIQHDGWTLVALALGIAVSGYRLSRGRWSVRWLPIVLCVVAALLAVGYVTNKDLRTLYPVGPDGNPITTQPGTLADFGIAIYVAGAGVAAASVGSLLLLRIAKQALEAADEELVDSWASENRGATTKKCLDCAETVLADARVCKHCGYRFAPAPVASSDTATKSSLPTQPRRRPASNGVPESLGRAPIPIGSPSASDLQVGHRVRVVLSGDDFDGKVGTVKRILDDGDVEVKFGPLSGTYCFGHDELKPI